MEPVTQLNDPADEGRRDVRPKRSTAVRIQSRLELPQFASIDRQLMHRNGNGSSFGFHAHR
jgi:hypothetical protein